MEKIYAEWHEYNQRNDLLGHLELREVECLVAEAIRRNLNKVFKEREAPAQQDGEPEGPCVDLFEVSIPRKRHEHVGDEQ